MDPWIVHHFVYISMTCEISIIICENVSYKGTMHKSDASR